MKKKKQVSRPSSHVFQRGPSFYQTYSTTVLKQGKPVRKRVQRLLGHTSQMNEAQAREAADEFMKNLRPEIHQGMTFQDYVERFYMKRVLQNKKAGQKHSGYLLRQHLLPYFGDQKIQNIEHQQVQEFFDLKSKQVINVPGRGEVRYSSATLSQVRTEMSLIMKAAKVDKAYFGENPCLGIRLPKAQPVLKLTALSPDQASRLIAALPSPAREMSMLSILLAVGEAELLGLQFRNLNLTDQHDYGTGLPPFSIRIERNFYLSTFDSTKCPRRSRNLSLCPELVVALKDYVGRQEWAEPEDVLFCGPKRGKPLEARNVKERIIAPICKELGIPKFSFHTGRRSFASISETMPDFTRTERSLVLGHSSASATMTQHYSHAEWERVRNGAAALGKRILGLGSTEPAKLVTITVNNNGQQ